MAQQERNPFVSIAGVIGGIAVAIVAIIAVLVRDQLWVSAWIVGALAVMGIALGYFAAKGSKPR